MRIAFFGLLLANVLVFGWNQWLSPSVAAPIAAASPGAGEGNGVAGERRIVLASEAPAPKVAAPAATDAAGNGDLVVPGSADLLAAAVADASAPIPAGLAAMAGITGELRRCVSMGPFAGLDRAAQATTMLKQEGYEPRQRLANGPVPDDYMVLIGQLKGEAEQGRVVGRLKRGGLDDAYPLPRLKDGYAVSVGIFSQPRRAERRAAAVGRMGFKAEVVERTRSGTVYWIDFDLKAPSGGAATSDPLLKASDPSQKWQLTACPEPKAVG
jgi:hypothetical protein